MLLHAMFAYMRCIYIYDIYDIYVYICFFDWDNQLLKNMRKPRWKLGNHR